MPDALDPVPLLKHLHAHGVEHIIIGGLAVSAHGHVRPSKDLDIVPDPAHANLERLVSALADAHALDAEVSDFDQAEIPMSAMRVEDLARGGNFRLVTDLGDVDIFQWVSGIEADDLYAELARDALAGAVEGIPVRVCGLDALRAMKRAAGRPQDIEDLRRLGKD
jgi:predicted nucleotidyltransferase